MEKKIKLLPACLLLLNITLLNAEDITLNNGRVLKNIEVIETGIDFVRVAHDEGIAHLESKELPPDLQIKWNMQPEEVEKRQQKLVDRIRAIRENEAKIEKEIRYSLSESQKNPRYIRPYELWGLLASKAIFSPLEIQYITLKWNEFEAGRLGEIEQRKMFANQLSDIIPQLNGQAVREISQVKKINDLCEKIQNLNPYNTKEVGLLKDLASDLKRDLEQSELRDKAGEH